MIHKHQHYDLLGKIVLERVIFTPPLRLREQMHAEACLLYSVKGNSTLYNGGESYSLTPDTGALMKCGNYFNHWHENKGDSKNEAVAIHLYPDLIRHVYQNDIPAFIVNKTPEESKAVHLLKEEEILKPYIDSLLLYFNNPEIIDEAIIILKVRELLSLLYKLDSSNVREMLHDLFNPDQYNFKEVVNKNLYEDLSLEELAHLCDMSLSSFKRRFKTVFDDTPASYFRNKRLEKAAQMLQFSDSRITDICFDCGFPSVDSFSRAFKQKFGTSPSGFRKQH